MLKKKVVGKDPEAPYWWGKLCFKAAASGEAVEQGDWESCLWSPTPGWRLVVLTGRLVAGASVPMSVRGGGVPSGGAVRWCGYSVGNTSGLTCDWSRADLRCCAVFRLVHLAHSITLACQLLVGLVCLVCCAKSSILLLWGSFQSLFFPLAAALWSMGSESNFGFFFN